MICNYCGCADSDIIAEYTRLERNNVRQCRNCGLVYLEIKKDKSEIELFYSSEYRKIPTSPILTPEEHFHSEVIQNDADNRIRFITNHMEVRGKRILEIGSASGSFLQKLSEYGCQETIGIELTEEYAEYARQKGFKVFTRPIEELNFRQEFDGIVSFFTLEHVYDPMAVIKATQVALRPKGSFFGEVPNQNDWRVQIFDDEVARRFHYDPNHYYYYSPTTLKNYLETCGFTNISFETYERYNSLVQLRNILCKQNLEKDIEEAIRKYIFPEDKKDEVRLPDTADMVGATFNKLFERGVNSELMGNIWRFAAYNK